jgi:hypothetical protein
MTAKNNRLNTSIGWGFGFGSVFEYCHTSAVHRTRFSTKT